MKHEAGLSSDHQKYPREYQEHYSDETERKGLQAEDECKDEDEN